MFFYNRHQHIDADGNPNLGLHGVVAGAVKVFDAQVLFDPFEEQFHFPPALVEQGDGQCGQDKIVGQEEQPLPRLAVHEMDAPQVVGIMEEA